VYPQPGRGGGWALLGGDRTDLSGLNATEAQTLFLLLGPAASIVPEAKSALRKLVRALPDTFRAEAETAASAVVVDPTAWGEREKERPPLVKILQAAVVRCRKVRLVYARPGREPSERMVDPWGLVDKEDVWYLVAGTEAGQRTFRVDRIVDASVTALPFERPADFELADAWGRVVDEMEQLRSMLSATVLISAKFVRVRVRVAAPTATMIAQQLAGWGAMVEVEQPESVQAELARMGAEVVERYGAMSGSSTY